MSGQPKCRCFFKSGVRVRVLHESHLVVQAGWSANCRRGCGVVLATLMAPPELYTKIKNKMHFPSTFLSSLHLKNSKN